MSAAAPAPTSNPVDQLSSEEVTQMLTGISGPGQSDETNALTPVVLKRRRVAGLVFENGTIRSHVDFTEVTFAGDVSFKGTSFLSGVNFTRAVFEGLVEFDGAIFTGPVLLSQADAGADDFSSGDSLARLATADFERVKFLRGATFVGTTFQVRANFRYVTFIGPAYFWRCVFKKNAYFSHLEVEPTSTERERHSKHGNRHVAEANFSYCLFESKADFSRAHFHGHTFFHRTAFLGTTAKFETVRFDDEVIFEGNRADVCFARNDLDPAIQKPLFERHVICENNDNEGYLNFEMPFTRVEELSAYLASNTGLDTAQRESVIGVWTDNSKPMFAGEKQGINFKNLFINSKAEPPQINHVDLRNCAFLGTNLGRIKFTDVKWPEKQIFFRFSKRKALYDELLLRTLTEPDTKANLPLGYWGRRNSTAAPNRYSAIATLYQQLRRGYAADGLMAEARDFYFGELEMGRYASGRLKRWLSLSFAYRALSGYGRQEGIAFSWLIFFLFAAFPTIYAVLNPALYHHWWAWPISHSLRVATFLRDLSSAPDKTVEPTVSQVTGFVEGLERVVVSIQAGLFAIAAKWRFDPGRYETNR